MEPCSRISFDEARLLQGRELGEMACIYAQACGTLDY